MATMLNRAALDSSFRKRWWSGLEACLLLQHLLVSLAGGNMFSLPPRKEGLSSWAFSTLHQLRNPAAPGPTGPGRVPPQLRYCFPSSPSTFSAQPGNTQALTCPSGFGQGS